MISSSSLFLVLSLFVCISSLHCVAMLLLGGWVGLPGELAVERHVT